MKTRTVVNYRKMWEEFHGCDIPQGWHIHHLDGDSHNNDISNLLACSVEEHAKLHTDMNQPWCANWILKGSGDMSGKNHFNWGKTKLNYLPLMVASEKTSGQNHYTRRVGFIVSEEMAKSRKSHSDRMSGEGNSFFGKRHTEDSKQKLRRENRDPEGLKKVSDQQKLKSHTCEDCNKKFNAGNYTKHKNGNNCSRKDNDSKTF